MQSCRNLTLSTGGREFAVSRKREFPGKNTAAAALTGWIHERSQKNDECKIAATSRCRQWREFAVSRKREPLGKNTAAAALTNGADSREITKK